MAKTSTRKSAPKKSGGAKKDSTVDKIAKAAMSKEMLAAGLAAAAAAISASPAARKKIRDAGMDAADSASQAANSVMSSATKLGSLIAEAVADAAQKVMSGKWTDEARPDQQTRKQRRRAARRRPSGKTARKAKSPFDSARAAGQVAAPNASRPRASRAPARRLAARPRPGSAVRAGKANRRPDAKRIWGRRQASGGPFSRRRNSERSRRRALRTAAAPGWRRARRHRSGWHGCPVRRFARHP